MKIYVGMLIIISLFLISGCSSGTSRIKTDFCGVHINFQYCKCAFHGEHCGAVGMSRSEAKTYVYSEYDKWLESLVPDEKEYGIIEKDGELHLNAKPGEILQIKTSDLPGWARGKIATVGATIAVVGPPDSIVEGDSRVLLDGVPIARVGDATAHGGSIVNGSANIFVNGKPVAVIGGYAVDPTVGPGSVPRVGGQITGNVR